LLFLGLTTGFSQSAYLGAYGGSYLYAVTDNLYDYSNNGIENYYHSKKISGGRGYNLGIKAGIKVNDYLGLELLLNSFNGKEGTLYSEYLYSYWVDTLRDTIMVKISGSRKARMIRIIPSLRFSLPGDHRVNPYIRIGGIIGFPKMTINTSDEDDDDRDGVLDYDDIVYEYKGGMAFGFHAGAGVEIKIIEKLFLSLEIAGNVISWTPERSTVTEWTTNGTNVINNKSKYDLETEYVKEYSYDPNNIDETSPRKSVRFSIPYSNIEWNAGIVYRF